MMEFVLLVAVIVSGRLFGEVAVTGTIKDLPAGMLALGISLLTVSWQSWKAAVRNPVEALRYE